MADCLVSGLDEQENTDYSQDYHSERLEEQQKQCRDRLLAEIELELFLGVPMYFPHP